MARQISLSLSGFGGRTVGSVEGLGENPRRRSLADAASTGEQIGVADAIGVDRVDQRLRHLLLPDQIVKGLGR